MDSAGDRSLPQYHLGVLGSGRAVGVVSPGAVMVEEPVAEQQRPQDQSSGDVGANTKKHGREERREVVIRARGHKE